jgi:hypothetical protein
MAMLSNGALQADRPAWAWAGEGHTVIRNNTKIWRTDRPIPMNYALPLDWHHVVPWNQLRDGWNRIHEITQDTATMASASAEKLRVARIEQAWEVLRLWLHAAGLNDSRDIVAQARRDGLNHADDLAGRICWAKWNLVEGPTNTYRTLLADDPVGGDPGGDNCDPFNNGSSGVRDRSENLVAWAGELLSGDLKLLAKRHVRFNAFRNVQLPRMDAATWERLEGKTYTDFKRPQWVSEGRFDKYDAATSDNHHPKWRKRNPA